MYLFNCINYPKRKEISFGIKLLFVCTGQVVCYSGFEIVSLFCKWELLHKVISFYFPFKFSAVVFIFLLFLNCCIFQFLKCYPKLNRWCVLWSISLYLFHHWGFWVLQAVFREWTNIYFRLFWKFIKLAAWFLLFWSKENFWLWFHQGVLVNIFNIK